MSRDPTVPVNLTTTTPVGPVERTLAATQSTDRVERLRYWRRGGSAAYSGVDVTPQGTLLVDFTAQSLTVGAATSYGAAGTVVNDGAYGDYTVARMAQTHESQLTGATVTVQPDGWRMENTASTTPSASRAFRVKVEFSKDIDLSAATSIGIEWGVPPYTDTSNGLRLGPRLMFANSTESNSWWMASTSMLNANIDKSRYMTTTIPVDGSSWSVNSGSVTWANVRRMILYMYVVYNNGGNYATIRRIWVNRRNARAKVAFTFDDGHYSVYSQAYPVLAARGIKAGIAVIRNHAQTGDDVTWMSGATIKALHDAGWATYNHMVDSTSQLCARMKINSASSSGTTAVFDTFADVVTAATIGNSYTIRNNFGPEYNGTFTLASKPSATQLSFTVSGESAVEAYAQTHAYCYMDWPDVARATWIADNVTACTTYLHGLGCTRGTNYFVAPNGAIDPSWWADLEAEGFVGARTTQTHFRLTGSSYAEAGMQYALGWFPRYQMATTALDAITDTVGNVNSLKALIDNACAEGSFVNFYGHIIAGSAAALTIDVDVLTQLADYIKTKIDAGEMEVIHMHEMAEATIP